MWRYSFKALCALNVARSIIRNKRTGHARIRMSSVIWGWKKYFAQFLTHANRNLRLADEDGSANIVEILQVYVTCHNGSLLLVWIVSKLTLRLLFCDRESSGLHPAMWLYVCCLCQQHSIKTSNCWTVVLNSVILQNAMSDNCQALNTYL